MSAEKVVPIREDYNFVSIIEDWLMDTGRNGGSQATKSAYTTDIKQFFSLVKGINNIELIKNSDVQISHDDISNFIKILRFQKQLKESSINRKLKACKSFYKYLYKKDIDIDINQKVVSGIETKKADSDSYATINKNHVLEIAEIAKNERRLGKEKKYLILFAFDTALRLQEILEMRTSYFTEFDEETYHFQIIGKGGKRNDRYPKKWFIDEICKELNIDIKIDQPLFQISDNAIQDFFTLRLKKQEKYKNMNNVVFHSVRGAGITAFYYNTKDPAATMRYAQHDSFDTTMRYITVAERNYAGSYAMLKEFDMSKLESVSREKLLDLVKELPQDVLMTMLDKLK
ncbi:tyrosine-type recombinase/integrase [Alkalihalobacillus sp. NPDC078783]